jgi:hypothetical protein
MTWEYRCVAGPTIVAVKNSKARDQAVRAFEEIMNAEAANGWEFVGIDEFHISEPEGFLSRRRVYVPSKILVFRRARVAPAVASALKAMEGKVLREGAARMNGAASPEQSPIETSDPKPREEGGPLKRLGLFGGRKPAERIEPAVEVPRKAETGMSG